MSNSPRFQKDGPKRRRRTRRDGGGRDWKEGTFSQYPKGYTLPMMERREARSPKVTDFQFLPGVPA